MLDVVNFIRKYGNSNITDISDFEIKAILEKHQEYGTLIVNRDSKGISSVIRWNQIAPDTLFVLDTVVRPDCRGINKLTQLTRRGIDMLPNKLNIQWIIFRRSKSPKSGYHVIDVEKFYKRKKGI